MGENQSGRCPHSGNLSSRFLGRNAFDCPPNLSRHEACLSVVANKRESEVAAQEGDRTKMLSPRQIDQYFTEGYLVVPDALREEDLAPVIREYEATIDRRARELHAAGKLSRLYEEEPFE